MATWIVKNYQARAVERPVLTYFVASYLVGGGPMFKGMKQRDGIPTSGHHCEKAGASAGEITLKL